MAEGNDVREHLNNSFDNVDKLADMEIAINPDLLTVMLLDTLSMCERVPTQEFN